MPSNPIDNPHVEMAIKVFVLVQPMANKVTLFLQPKVCFLFFLNLLDQTRLMVRVDTSDRKEGEERMLVAKNLVS